MLLDWLLVVELLLLLPVKLLLLPLVELFMLLLVEVRLLRLVGLSCYWQGCSSCCLAAGQCFDPDPHSV